VLKLSSNKHNGDIMNMTLLQNAVNSIKSDIELSISTATFDGKTYPTGRDAKEALIRSQKLINHIHEVVKLSLREELVRRNITHDIHPPVGYSSPELAVAGYIKKKYQDVVIVPNRLQMVSEVIDEGLDIGEIDNIGKSTSEKLIVVGVRSQLSSIAKNFDTLMERTFAETFNLRLRLPKLVMGEVYLIPIYEYDDVQMVSNNVGFKDRQVSVEKFIRVFLGISGRSNDNIDKSLYKYDRSCLILVDLRSDQPTIIETTDQLIQKRIVSSNFSMDYNRISPVGFAKDLIDNYQERH